MRLIARTLWNRLRSLGFKNSRAPLSRRAARRKLEFDALEDRFLLATATGVIAGVAFIDTNGNTAVDTAETKAPGLVVDLTGTTTQGTAIDVKATTNPDGAYTFTNVLPGVYNVAIEDGQSLELTSGSSAMGLVVGSGSQTVTQNLPTAGFADTAISLRQFLTSSTAADLPFAPPGDGLGLANFRPNNTPTIKTAIADVAVSQNSTPTLIDLAGHYFDTDLTNTTVQLNTSEGPINVQLFDATAPQTVANFLDYVNNGTFNNDIFHRLASGFVLQGGGFNLQENPTQIIPVATLPPVQNEFGQSNLIGTLAMAKVGNDPNSATSQFFINLANNSANLDNQNGGFTVFGKLASQADQDVVNKLTAYTVTNQSNFNSALDTLPLKNYTHGNNSPTFPTDSTAANYGLIKTATITNQDEVLKYTIISNTNPGLVTPTLNSERLSLAYTPGQTGTATITLQATDRFGAFLQVAFKVTVS